MDKGLNLHIICLTISKYITEFVFLFSLLFIIRHFTQPFQTYNNSKIYINWYTTFKIKYVPIVKYVTSK